MGKKLIIAEKPSVAGDIARALGNFKRHDDYYENDEYTVSSAVGHLLELTLPEAERTALKLHLALVNHDYRGFGQPNMEKSGACNIDFAAGLPRRLISFAEFERSRGFGFARLSLGAFAACRMGGARGRVVFG